MNELASPMTPGTLRLALGGVRITTRRRSVVATGAVLLLTIGLVLLQLTTGSFPMPLSRVLATLGGHGTAVEELAIYDLRLPRALTAVLAGAAFGASGAVYQSVTRNPLGSPDIIGFTYGAAFGAVFAIAVLGASDAAVTLAALAGGLGVALVVYVLAFRGGVQGYRLILVGIGISAVLESFVSYLLLKASIIDAQEAYTWLTGSLNGSDWTDVRVGLVGLVVLAPVVVGLGPGLRTAELGEDTARALGVSVGRDRMLALLVGAVLCAVAVICAGPITFVSLAAPQIARRLGGSPTVAVIPSMALGALLMVLSDLLAQHVYPDSQLPVGVTTLALGGAYLAWLIAREGRNRIG
ncbi:FecCD family ABC transporter permease [Nocardioides sp.]|uniref:FecCD family ABC transporter permease n=1 Tax=Nocardioides sp. TaxID=35761 RepID=UPI0039E2776D